VEEQFSPGYLFEPLSEKVSNPGGKPTPSRRNILTAEVFSSLVERVHETHPILQELMNDDEAFVSFRTKVRLAFPFLLHLSNTSN
jgi:hypothetical protein